MTALYLPPPVQTRTPSQTLAYLAERAFRAVGIVIGTVSTALTMIAFFGATS